MSGFYLFVSSNDSVQYHKDNNYHDFIVELDREYDLRSAQTFRNRSQWCVALVEISLENMQNNISPRIKDDVLVLCDLIRPSYIKSTERRILRPISSNSSGRIASLFQPYYIELDTLTFSNIRITLLDKQLKKLSSLDGWPDEKTFSLSCTLHFQKM